MVYTPKKPHGNPGPRPGFRVGWGNNDDINRGAMPHPEMWEVGSQLSEWEGMDYCDEWGMEHAILTGQLRMEVIK